MPAEDEDSVGRWVAELIAADRLHDFYTSSRWLRLRREILAENKSECQWCKRKGFYAKADTVHHTQFVRKHPELALSRTYLFDGVQYTNLIPLCRACHELAHGHRKNSASPALTQERW